MVLSGMVYYRSWRMTSVESGQKAVPNIISENGQYESNYISLV